MHSTRLLLYDGRVKRICLLFVDIIILLFLATLVSAPSAYAAQCNGSVSIEPYEMPVTFYNTLTITTTEDCFSTGQLYWIIAYPKRQEFPSGLDFGARTMPPAVANIKADNKKTITTVFKLGGTISYRGIPPLLRVPIPPSKYPGKWEVAVCTPQLDSVQNGDYTPCTDRNKHLVAAEITVQGLAPTPTPTISPDTPVVPPTSQPQCGYQVGTDITIYSITKTSSDKRYNWWWYYENGNTSAPSWPFPGVSGKYLDVPIPSSETTQPGKRRFCIDETLSRIRSTGPCPGLNGIDLLFTAPPPSEDEKRCGGPPIGGATCNPGDTRYVCTGGCNLPGIKAACTNGVTGAAERQVCNSSGTGWDIQAYQCVTECKSCVSNCKYRPGERCTACAVMTVFSCDSITGQRTDTNCYISDVCGAQSFITPLPTLTIIPPPCKEFVQETNPQGTPIQGRQVCKTLDTAVGPIDTDPAKFVQQLFGIILSLAGGIAVLLIIYSGYQLMISQGNAEKVQGAKETLTSAIVGLIFIIFSLVILQIIGVDILRIPGFGQ